MALGDYVETTFVEGTAPGISATRLNNNENKTAELDSAQAAHVVVKSSSSALGHMKVGTGLPVDINGVVSAPRVAIGKFTRDMTLASGTQVISGLGFIPRKVTFYTVIDGLPGASCWGFDIGTARHCLTNAYATAPGDFYSDRGTIGASIEIWTTDGDWCSAKIQSFDASGFTLSWYREGVPNDTAEIMYMAEE